MEKNKRIRFFLPIKWINKPYKHNREHNNSREILNTIIKAVIFNQYMLWFSILGFILGSILNMNITTEAKTISFSIMLILFYSVLSEWWSDLKERMFYLDIWVSDDDFYDTFSKPPKYVG